MAAIRAINSSITRPLWPLRPPPARMDAAVGVAPALPDALDPPDALDSGFHCVRTHWIRGFMAFRLVRRILTVMLMVLACPESGFTLLVDAAPAPGRRSGAAGRWRFSRKKCFEDLSKRLFRE
jgi:hypothetical protein